MGALADLAPRPRPTPADVSDRELIERFLASRDESSFRELYRQHTPYLFRLALRLTGGASAEAEDAVQEAWIRASQALGRFRGESQLKTWLGGFVVNCCREGRRRARRDEPLPHDFDAPATAPPHPEPATALDAETAIAALPATLREVLVLHAIEGYTHEEIAALLAIPAGTSKSRLFDARRALRRSLGLDAGGAKEGA